MVRFNENNEVIQDESCRAILAGLERGEDISCSMEELAGLAEAAGAEVLGLMVQKLAHPDPATFIGRGKVEELALLRENMEADTVIFNDELSGMQMRNLEDALGCRVIDRTILILDIFAARATSKEGKLQVELAQLQYRLPRLTGFGWALSRLGGGIGTRGPGEKKLETDRRHIARRMEDIRRELAPMKHTRSVQRSRREKAEIPVVALVGYTNSGKSALMNRLLAMSAKEEKQVTEKDMLFATLDTQQRSIQLDSRHECILIDTVGFVSRLPHSLVQAFKATLEEVTHADLLLHVVDASYEQNDLHIQVTEKVMEEIGAGRKEKIIVYNKADLLPETFAAPRQALPADGKGAGTGAAPAAAASGSSPVQPPAPKAGHIFVSAKRGDNMEQLMAMIKERLFAPHVRAKLRIPYSRGDISSYLCAKAQVLSMDYDEQGTVFSVELPPADYNRLREYELKP